jgi:hypothetical protein
MGVGLNSAGAGSSDEGAGSDGGWSKWGWSKWGWSRHVQGLVPGLGSVDPRISCGCWRLKSVILVTRKAAIRRIAV